MKSASLHQSLPVACMTGALVLALAAIPATAQQKGWTTAVAPVQETGALPDAARAPSSAWQPVATGTALEAAAELSRQIAPKSAKQFPARVAATGPAQPPPAAKPIVPTSPRLAAAPSAVQTKAPQTVPSEHDAPAVDTPEAAQSAAKSEAKSDDSLGIAEKYCINIADAALDARYSLQKKSLIDLQQQLDKRIELLQAKTVEYQKWVARRDEFSKKANEGLVKIYAKMQPDAAAAQLGAMDEETAAALLAKLDPRNSSVILNEMPAAKAASLTAMIAGAAKVRADQPAATPPGDKKS